MWLGNSHFFQVFQLVTACVIVWWLADFKCFQNHQVNFRYLGFHLVVTSRHVILLVSCDLADVLMTLSLRSADLIMGFDWLQPLFEYVLVVSGLRTFQQACSLYNNKVVADNLPVTFLLIIWTHVLLLNECLYSDAVPYNTTYCNNIKSRNEQRKLKGGNLSTWEYGCRFKYTRTYQRRIGVGSIGVTKGPWPPGPALSRLDRLLPIGRTWKFCWRSETEWHASRHP